MIVLLTGLIITSEYQATNIIIDTCIITCIITMHSTACILLYSSTQLFQLMSMKDFLCLLVLWDLVLLQTMLESR